MKDVFYGWIDTIKPLIAERLGSAVCYGDGSGNFKIADLPEDLQLSPVFAFQKIDAVSSTERLYICGGNFFDVIPYEGRYDGQPLALFSINKQNQVRHLPQTNLSELKGQVRDLKWLHSSAFGKILAAAVNNDSLVWLYPDKTSAGFPGTNGKN